MSKQFKGQLQDFPEEVVEKMLQRQEEQTGERDISVFETDAIAPTCNGGFDWDESEEGFGFWIDVIQEEDFQVFFDRYPREYIDAGEPEQEEEMAHVELEELSARYTQPSDEDQKKDQCLEIFTADNGSGKYFVLMTDRWAVDSIDELIVILRDFEKRAKQD